MSRNRPKYHLLIPFTLTTIFHSSYGYHVLTYRQISYFRRSATRSNTVVTRYLSSHAVSGRKPEDEDDVLDSPPSANILEEDDLLASRSSFQKIQRLTVSQLKQQLRLRGMKVSGTKADLIQRLSEAIDPKLKRRRIARLDDEDEDDNEVTIVDDWGSSVSSKGSDESSKPLRQSSSKAQTFARDRGKELVDINDYLDENDKGKDSKSFHFSGNLDTEEKNDEPSYTSETWGDEAKIVDDFDGRSPVVDGLSRTIVEYRGSNRTMIQAYVVASRESLKPFLAGGDRTVHRSVTETEIQLLNIQLSKEKASKLPVKVDDIDGVDEDDEEGHYKHVMERDYGDWGKYSLTGVHLSSQEIKGLILLSDHYGPFTDNMKSLADKIAFELQPIVVFAPDLFRGKYGMDDALHMDDDWWSSHHPGTRVSVDIRAAAAALRQQYGVNSVSLFGIGYGGGKALELAARSYPNPDCNLDDIGGSVGPPHVDPSAVVAWYPINYDANSLFGPDRKSMDSLNDYQTSVMAIFAGRDTLPGARSKDAERLKEILSEDERIKDTMVKVFPDQSHGFAHNIQSSIVRDELDRFNQDTFGGEFTNVDYGDAEAAYLLSTAFLETYSRVFLPTVGPHIQDDDEWSNLQMKDLSKSKLKNIRMEIEQSLAKHEDVDLDLQRMHPLEFMNPISDMEDMDEKWSKATNIKPYGLSPDDDADTMLEKLEASVERGDLGFLPGFGEIPIDDTEQAYW